jgi:hypothetical protein
MGMDWLTNPAMAAMYGGGFWPASAYAANMATAQRPAKPSGMTADGQPAPGAEAAGPEAAPGAEAQAAGDQAAHDAATAAAGGLPQVAFPYGMPTTAAPAGAPKHDGTAGNGAPAEGQVVVGAPEGAAAGAAATDIASGQPVMDAQTAAAQQAATAAGNPIAWQYWQYMYTNLYANAANAAQAVNPTVYSNMYANWTKKHEPGTGGGCVLAGCQGV